MSWSVSAKGKRTDVRKNVGDQFDASALGYTSQGMREGNDLLAIRGIVLGAIDTLKYDEATQEINVYCYGSRGEDSYMSATLGVNVVQQEAPPAPPVPAPPETQPEVPSAK